MCIRDRIDSMGLGFSSNASHGMFFCQEFHQEVVEQQSQVGGPDKILMNLISSFEFVKRQ